MQRDRIEELFAPFAAVSVKRMFGGHGVYADGLFFALEADGEIYLKADATTQALFEAAGARRFVYQGAKRPVAMSYWRLVDAAFEDEDELRHWAGLALAAARRAQSEKAAKASRRKSAAR
ncbi:MAG: TfoX/Sxy family protein [Methylocystis sp.]|nr:TfoX/Sxy family protein [Methylocystis sp.]MBI3274695.1 TfoX/Sxy family protein [Methylocystis sp.]